MTEDFVRKAPIHAMNNRETLVGTCGCYHCMEQIDPLEIIDWTDGEKTAICPKCGIDAVLSVSDVDLLKKINDYWFAVE